jgi:uncharacterized membrane protein
MELIYKLAAFVPCHRRPDRSIHINGKPFPLCARCMSILLGYLFIPLLFFLPFSIAWWVGVLCQLPMLLDGGTQYFHWRESNNTLRMITGILSGFGLSVLVIWLARHMTQWVTMLS